MDIRVMSDQYGRRLDLQLYRACCGTTQAVGCGLHKLKVTGAADLRSFRHWLSMSAAVTRGY